MHQQKKDGETRDPYAMLSGGDPPDDYSDWDNPEDAEDAPEGYYDQDEDEDDDSYVPGPDDPDYDLSEAHGYADWDEGGAGPLIPQWVVTTVAIALILAIAIPALLLVR